MPDRFRPGARVITSRCDPAHHTRLPRYVRGAIGTVIDCQGSHPFPDANVRGVAMQPMPVYTVSFRARDLFGEGDHAVTVDIWEQHLTGVKEPRDDR